MSGAAFASSMAASDNNARIELLCWCCSREVMSPCSGVATTAATTTARPARTMPSMATLPLAAIRTAKYTAISTTATHTVRFSE